MLVMPVIVEDARIIVGDAQYKFLSFWNKIVIIETSEQSNKSQQTI